MEKTLLPIPAKRYFTIGEVSDLCCVKPHVLRYWEQEFTQLKPLKRRGNRRYYQHHEVLLIRRIRDLLYEQGFTISGARNRLIELGASPSHISSLDIGDDGDFGSALPVLVQPLPSVGAVPTARAELVMSPAAASAAVTPATSLAALRDELMSIRSLLEIDF